MLHIVIMKHARDIFILGQQSVLQISKQNWYYADGFSAHQQEQQVPMEF